MNLCKITKKACERTWETYRAVVIKAIEKSLRQRITDANPIRFCPRELKISLPVTGKISEREHYLLTLTILGCENIKCTMVEGNYLEYTFSVTDKKQCLIADIVAKHNVEYENAFESECKIAAEAIAKALDYIAEHESDVEGCVQEGQDCLIIPAPCETNTKLFNVALRSEILYRYKAIEKITLSPSPLDGKLYWIVMPKKI